MSEYFELVDILLVLSAVINNNNSYDDQLFNDTATHNYQLPSYVFSLFLLLILFYADMRCAL